MPCPPIRKLVRLARYRFRAPSGDRSSPPGPRTSARWTELLLLALSAPACTPSQAAGPKLLNLSRGFRPRPPAAGPWRPTADGGPPLELRPADDGGVWISGTLPRDGFRGTAFQGVVRSRLPIPPVGSPADGAARSRLVVGGTPWTEEVMVRGGEPPSPGAYVLSRHNLFAVIDPEHVPDARDWEVEVYVDRGRMVDGSWHLTMPRYSADGIPVLPGERQSVECDLPAESALRFATVAFNTNEEPGLPRGAARFEVLLDGEVLFEHVQTVRDDPQAEPHRVRLPPESRADARLVFRVEGPACISAFLTPRVGPTEPEADPRPDIVLFLADTFRADNLRAYGGRGLTPNLDRLAEESAVFARTWTPTPWTLPAQCSMLSGLYPHQHGVVERTRRLGDDVLTLAERLRAEGYRTGAVTGGGYVAPAFGLDQGFEWFDHYGIRWDVERTAEDALDFLEGDDGRPSFLFVQTYRTHAPYLREAGDEGEIELDDAWQETFGRYREEAVGWRNGDPMSHELRRAVEDLHGLYDSAVAGLDRGFGALRERLEERGRWENSWLVFTADHGEAFGEHENYGHGAGLWEELTRVPLLVRGPGLAARRVESSASLVDLPRTVASIAGIEPGRDWGGVSLLELGFDRPAYLFECRLGGEPFTAGAVEGSWKLELPDTPEALAAGKLIRATDLSRDPGEHVDLESEVDRESVRRLGLELLELRRGIHSAAHASVPDDTHEAMGALGYAGEEADSD